MQPSVVSSVDDPALVEMRRNQFVKAAGELFARKGYHGTTIRDITQSAGISTGLIYSYVSGKEDVLFLVLENILTCYLREIPRALENVEGAIERFCATVRAYCRVVGDKPHATLLAYRETKSLKPEHQAVIKDMELRTNRLIIERIEECIAAGYFRPVHVELLSYRIVLLAHGWALKAWRLQQFVTLDEYIEEGVDIFLHALMTPAGWRHFEDIQKRTGTK